MESDRYRPLDGLRGVAILLVLFNHFTPDLLMPDRAQEWAKKILTTGGWIGVDLFFVLSGFLITSILLRTKGAPDYFLNFYARRILRIFPLYYAALAIVFIALPSLGIVSGPWFIPIRESQVFHWLYSTNFAFWLLPKEALSSVGHIELRHLWSLAVEEHFYLFWPAIVFALGAAGIKRTCIALIVSAFLFRELGIYLQQPPGYFTLTFCRWDTLAAGALIAVLIHESSVARAKMLSPAILMVALSSIYLGLSFYLHSGLWPPTMIGGGMTFIAMLFSGCLMLVINPTSVASRVMDAAPLRFFGKYSYGIYIIHGLLAAWLGQLISTERWVETFGQSLFSVLAIASVKIAISALCAVISWHIIEEPFLRLKVYFSGTMVAQGNKP